MRILPHKSGFIIYILLWLVYLLQAAIWQGGSSIPQLLLVIIILWSLMHLSSAIIHFSKLPKSLKFLMVLLFSYVLYGLGPLINHQVLYVEFSGTAVQPFSYMKSALISILPVYSFYYFTKKNEISVKILKIFSVIFFAVIIITYYTNEANLLRIAIDNGSSRREFTNNLSYGFIYLIPYVYLIKNKRNGLLFLSAIAVFLLAGMKRGAILIGTLGIVFYMRDFLANEKSVKKFYAILLIVLGLLFLSYVGIQMYEQSPYFQFRVERTLEGSMSGRDEITDSLLSYYFNRASLLQIIFGSGANATLLHSVNFAHNDWFEILIDQGIIGFLLLLAFYFYLYLDIRKMKAYNKLFYNSFRTLFWITFLKTFFSMSICNMLPYLTLLMGFYLWQLNYYKYRSNEKRVSSNINHSTSLQC